MRLEYFQLIDRIVELKLADQTIRTEARVPTASTIFEGHFPGYPLMPGVLLIEAMAQTSGWLLIAVTKADIRCDGKLVCNAEITFRLVEFPTPEFRASMEKMAAILEFPTGALAMIDGTPEVRGT